MEKKVYGYIVEEKWLADYAISRGVSTGGDQMSTACAGIMVLEQESGIRDIFLTHTGDLGNEDIVLYLYSNEDYDIENMCFPDIAQDKINKLAELLERPGEKPKWYMSLFLSC